MCYASGMTRNEDYEALAQDAADAAAEADLEAASNYMLDGWA